MAVELPFPPRRGWRGVGGEGGNEQGFETSAISSRKAFEWFLGRWPLPDLREQLPKMVQFLRCSPHSHPQPSLAPPGEKGSSTAVCGRVLEVDEFTVNRQPSKRPSTAVWGRVFEGVEFRVLCQPSK